MWRWHAHPSRTSVGSGGRRPGRGMRNGFPIPPPPMACLVTEPFRRTLKLPARRLKFLGWLAAWGVGQGEECCMRESCSIQSALGLLFSRGRLGRGAPTCQPEGGRRGRFRGMSRARRSDPASAELLARRCPTGRLERNGRSCALARDSRQ